MKKVLTTIYASDTFGQKQRVTKQSVIVWQFSVVVSSVRNSYKHTDTSCINFKMIWTYDLTSIFKVERRPLENTLMIKQLT